MNEWIEIGSRSKRLIAVIAHFNPHELVSPADSRAKSTQSSLRYRRDRVRHKTEIARAGDFFIFFFPFSLSSPILE